MLTNNIIICIVSVIMNDLYDLSNLINKYTTELKGVFTINELKTLFNDFNEVALFRKINKLVKKNILSNFCRGFYIAQNFDIEQLSSKINEASYISFGNILAKELIISSIPKYTLMCIKLGKNRVYKYSNYKIIYLSIAQHLFFGFETIKGINYALKEKAFLDTLFFNIYQDINIKLLNINLVYSFLKKYKNSKFIIFVKRYIDERI